MTRRPWLPYALWALLVGGVVLFGQPGFSYCAELHPRLCTTALLSDLSSQWDPGQGLLIVVMLVTGWIVIAAGRNLGRSAGLAFAGWSTLITVVMFFVGGNIPTCLGLGVTVDSCRAAFGLPPETAWDRIGRGPGPMIMLLIIGWLTLAATSAWARRQRGGL